MARLGKTDRLGYYDTRVDRIIPANLLILKILIQTSDKTLQTPFD